MKIENMYRLFIQFQLLIDMTGIFSFQRNLLLRRGEYMGGGGILFTPWYLAQSTKLSMWWAIVLGVYWTILLRRRQKYWYGNHPVSLYHPKLFPVPSRPISIPLVGWHGTVWNIKGCWHRCPGSFSLCAYIALSLSFKRIGHGTLVVKKPKEKYVTW